MLMTAVYQESSLHQAGLKGYGAACQNGHMAAMPLLLCPWKLHVFVYTPSHSEAAGASGLVCCTSIWGLAPAFTL